MKTTEVSWFKSSYSGGDGDDCVEAAFSWHKSSYSSSSGDNCVEVSAARVTVRIRDSKNAQGPHLTVPADSWAAFLPYATGLVA
ncbi:DUF397 domain-containing protein [Streptomyces sp. NPDC018019]|uniref:DUF397 domain-containing protein n=1 Tax=Streptomyces sp. NPDC018019 TaxID=3365030 RepID=UPI0037ACC1BA